MSNFHFPQKNNVLNNSSRCLSAIIILDITIFAACIRVPLSSDLCQGATRASSYFTYFENIGNLELCFGFPIIFETKV